MKKKLTKTICLLSLVSLSTMMVLSFVDENQQNKQELQNNRIINNKQSNSMNLIDYPYYVLNQAISSDNITIVVLADGYTKDDQQKFMNDAKKVVDRFFTIVPFRKLKNHINFYAIPIVSSEKSDINKPKDTFFEVKHRGWGIEPSTSGRKKALNLTMQVANHIVKDNVWFKPHILLNTTQQSGAATNSWAASTMNSDFTFSHENGHLFGLPDEYVLNGKFKSSRESASNDLHSWSDTNDPSKVNWKELLGYNNTGIKSVGKGFVASLSCIMNESKTGIFCEVCKLSSFKFITEKFKNDYVYVGKPIITEEFDELKQNNGIYEFNKYKWIITSDVNWIYEVNNKFAQVRTIIDNPSKETKRYKLKFTFEDKLYPQYNQTNEKEFIINPNERKQIKLNSVKPIEYARTSNDGTVIIKSEIFEIIDGKEVFINSSEKNDVERTFKINFIDNQTKKQIDFIGQQEYIYQNGIEDVDQIEQINLTGYKKVKVEKVNNDEANWIYEKLPTKKIKLTLRDSIDESILQEKEWELSEGDSITSSDGDFLIDNGFYGYVEAVKKTINYNSDDINLDYYVFYTSYMVGVDKSLVELKQGEDYNKDNVWISNRVDADVWKKNKVLSERIYIDYGNFDKNVVGEYQITHYWDETMERQLATITVRVLPNDALSQDEIDVNNEISKLMNNYPKANSLGESKNVNDVDQTNIASHVTYWPLDNNGVEVTIKQFLKNASKGTITVIFEFSKNNIRKDSTSIVVKGFKVDQIQPPNTNDERDVNEEVNKINNTKFVLNELGKKTSITDSNVNENTIQNYVANWPMSNKNVSIIVKSGSFSKDTKNGLVSFILQLEKNNAIGFSNEITINGFLKNVIEEPIQPSSKNNRMKPWMIALIVISSITGIGLLIWLIIYIVRKRRYL